MLVAYWIGGSGMGLGLFFAFLSGICNGLFTAPMKIIPRWRWENIWLVFIITSCWAMAPVLVFLRVDRPAAIFAAASASAVTAAAAFGFAWGFGAILFGLSVDRLGVSLANSLVIGLSSALGSVVPLVLKGAFNLEARQLVLFAGVAAFLIGVAFCGRAGKLREAVAGAASSAHRKAAIGILFSLGAGVMSAVFNIGYSLALPLAAAGERLGYSSFDSTNAIWLLMLGGGGIPNVCFCAWLLWRNRTAGLFAAPGAGRGFALSIAMGLLWGGSIFLYGAATPRLGDIGPSIGWPLSLAVGLLVANLMGVLLGEWKKAGKQAVDNMRMGIAMIVAAILICAASTRVGP